MSASLHVALIPPNRVLDFGLLKGDALMKGDGHFLISFCTRLPFDGLTIPGLSS